VRILSACLAFALLSACAAVPRPPARGSQAAILGALSDTLQYQYHACVPLGWRPVAVAGTYYPGYIASLQNYAEWLDAIWRARIDFSEISKPAVKPVFEVLNHLTKAGLLVRKQEASFYDYFLTANALPYYYGWSRYNNNYGKMQYLCYSTLVPDRLVWMQRIARPNDWRGRAQWYRVSFAWKASAPAQWANDPFLREHSVILAPVKSPAVALMYYNDSDWHVGALYDRTWMLPVLRDVAAWKMQRPGR
jgi:hypothetical protein